MKKLNKTSSFTNCTLTSQSCRNIHNIKSEKGNLISYGNLNLTLTIILNQNDLIQNNIEWEKIKNYNSLSFIKRNTYLWPRIKLSSTNKTLQILLNVNKILEKKIKIKHICFRKIKYQQNFDSFKDFLNSVTNTNGLYLDSHSICPCELSVQLRLRYKDKRKLFVLCGEKTPLDDDDDDDGDYDMKEDDNVLLEEGTNYDEIPNWEDMNGGLETFDIDEKMDDESYNPFIDIPKEINNVNDFHFIYFNYEDYNGNPENTFGGKITMKYLYDYFIYLRKYYKNNKIVLNIGNQISNFGIESRDLLSITNIAIFYERNKLFQILNNIRNEEDKIKREEEYFKHYYNNKLKNEEIQNYLEEEDKRANLLEYLQQKASEKSMFDKNNTSEQDEIDLFPLFRNNRYNKTLYSMKLKKKKAITLEEEKKVEIKDNKYFIPLTKVEMFNYYKNDIIERDLSMKPNEEKMIIVLDELSKLYIVQFNKSYEKPFIFDLDIKLYEPINVHNIKKIMPFKDIIKKNMEEYTILYIGYLLSSLLSLSTNDKKVSEEAALFIGYYGGQKILKEIVKSKRDEISENSRPKNDSFYMPNLNQEEIDNLISQAEKRKKEIKFILDGNNKNIIKLKLYNPLLDKYAVSYLNNDKNKNYFKKYGFITEQGKLLYDPVYRESLLIGKNEKKVKNEKDLIKTCHEIITKNNFKMKEIECLNKYKNKNERLSKFIVGYKQKKPQYEIYLKESKNPVLPKIKKNGSFVTSEFSSPIRMKSSGNFKLKSVKKKLNINI